MIKKKKNEERILEKIDKVLEMDEGIEWGERRMKKDEGIMLKVMGMERENVREEIRKIWEEERKEVKGERMKEKLIWEQEE